MTSESKESCALCTNSFNEANHQDMVLHCGHNFCLSCLVSLHSSGSHKCPTCRADWVQFELKAIGLLKPQASTNGREVQEVPKEEMKKLAHLCKNHQFPFVYWQNDMKVFYCKQCVVEEVPGKFVLIDAAVPLITADIAQKVKVVHKIGREDIDNLEKTIADFKEKLDHMSLFQKQLDKNKGDLVEMIDRLELLLNDRSSVFNQADELENKCKKFQSEADLDIVIIARNVLEELVKPSVLPLIDESNMLLCNIVSSLAVLFEGEPEARDPPSVAASLIYGLSTSNDCVLKLLIEPRREEQRFETNSSWTVNDKNYLAALLALAHGKKPVDLMLIGNYSKPNALPRWSVSAIAKATKGCDVKVRLYDSFLKPQLGSNNNEELKRFILENRLTQFIGHLDAEGIASLPTSISYLGLAINSAADAEAVSNLKTWTNLPCLGVAVSDRVSVEDLKPLPSVPGQILYFFGLTDDQIHRIRPVINALVPSLSLLQVYFPNCQLTATGLRSLAQLLQGTTIGCVGIELPEQWDAGVKTSIAAEMTTAVKAYVRWNTDFLHQ